MKSALWTLGLGMFLLLNGCAAGNAALLKQFVGKQVVVSIAPDVPLSGDMVFDVAMPAAGGALQQVLLEGVKRSALDALRDTARQAAKPLGTLVASKMRQNLKAANIFGDVTEQGGQVVLKLSISRWGLEAPQGPSSIRPVLEVQADLVVPQIGTIWSAKQSAVDLGRQVKTMDLRQFALNPRTFSDPWAAVADAVTQALAAKLSQM